MKSSKYTNIDLQKAINKSFKNFLDDFREKTYKHSTITCTKCGTSAPCTGTYLDDDNSVIGHWKCPECNNLIKKKASIEELKDKFRILAKKQFPY